MTYLGPMQNQITRPYPYIVLNLEGRQNNVRIHMQNMFGRKSETQPTFPGTTKWWAPM